jgi:hypothetical protein
MNKNRVYAVLIIIFVLLIANIIIQKDINKFGGSDKDYYIQMASEPFGNDELNMHPPFAYRIGFPSLVFMINFFIDDLDLSFWLLTNIILFLTMYLVFYYLDKIKDFSKKQAILGVILFALIPYLLIFNLYDFYLVDSLLFLFIILFFILFESRYKYRLFFIFLIISLGVFVKEYILFLIPVFYFYELGFKDKKLFDKTIFLRTILLGLIPLLIFILLRMFIPVIGGEKYISSILFDWSRLWSGLFNNIFLKTYFMFSLFWIFISLNFKNIILLFKERKDYLVILILTFLAGLLVTDFHRVFVYIFPIIIPLMIVNICEKWSKYKNLILLVFILQFILLFLRYTIGYSFSMSNVFIIGFELLCFLFTIVVSIYLIFKKE